MATIVLLLHSLISLSFAVSQTGDLACNKNIWTKVASPADWIFEGNCVYANTNSVDGAMVWIGENMPDSVTWTDYTFEARMDPLDVSAGGANGGIAFNIQNVGDRAVLGKYYALSLFPTLAQTSIKIHLGKWNDGSNNDYGLVIYNIYNETWKEGQYFHIKAEISSTSNSVTIKSYLDGHYLGTYTDTDNAFLYGSIGMRNYKLPAQFTDICVNGCGKNDNSTSGAGGWIFIGILFGGIFLYCSVGYIINGNKSKDWGNVKRNIPQFEFWTVLPKLVMVGCQVSYEVMRRILRNKLGRGKNESLMETTAAADNEYDADDQVL